MILHIFGGGHKFLDPFANMIYNNFDYQKHQFALLTSSNDYGDILYKDNVVFIHHDLKSCVRLIIMMNRAEKIIVHGLFSRQMILSILLSNNSNKCYVALWGGDFYDAPKEHRIHRYAKSKILRNCKGISFELKEDLPFVQRWYKTNAQYFPCLLYYSNVVNNKTQLISQNNSELKIQIGNSADPSNNHFEILNALRAFNNCKIKLYIPLSYGDMRYAEKVTEYANKLFPGKVVVLRDFVPFDQYMDFLNSLDIAIFAHKRQQALGNTVSLLTMGKKVYLRDDVTVYRHFNNCGVHVYTLDSLSKTLLTPMTDEEKEFNHKFMKENFTEKVLIRQWKTIFDD